MSESSIETWARQNRADIATVVCVTERHDTGIDYYVLVSLRSLAASAFEEGEDRLELWRKQVQFGATDATHAGGYVFRSAAIEQERIAALVSMIARGGI